MDAGFGNELLHALYDEINEIAPRIPKLKAVLLYGSHARGDADLLSDIDLLFLYDMKHKPIGSAEEKKASLLLGEAREHLKNRLGSRVNIQALHTRVRDLQKNFLKNVAAESKVLWGSGFLVSAKPGELGLNPYVIFSYRISGLENSKKVMLAYALYGRKEKKRRGAGILESVGGIRLGDGAVMVRREFEKEIDEVLRNFRAESTKYLVWM
ncbi:MAG: nucleotidyltransferase domain-containing protein [Candidatus Micrarchaeota archaeon]